jgi:hypothetical protein
MQRVRDFGRFETTIGGKLFRPVEELHIEENLENIRAAIREHLMKIGVEESSQLSSCTTAVLESVFNTPRRGEVWNAVRAKCNLQLRNLSDGAECLHTRPTTSKIPTTAIFDVDFKSATMTIGTAIQIWEEGFDSTLFLIYNNTYFAVIFRQLLLFSSCWGTKVGFCSHLYDNNSNYSRF